jgi:ATP-binding protein involved in chromosome partitioning
MGPEPSGNDRGRDDNGLAARVRDALVDAAVGADVAGVSLAALGALSVQATGGSVSVEVTLPIPAGVLREAIEREIEAALVDVDGVSTVASRFQPRVPDPGARVDLLPDVKNVVAVSSGKGGVGKSTVAVNLATALAATGASVGLLDADVYGPNAPTMLGLGERIPKATPDDRMVPREAHGVKVMSMGFIVDEDDPVIWRGPLVDDLLEQLFGDVEWGALDYLIVDLPPGTGDAQLSLVQHLPLTGAVVVTTPQPVAVDDARRGLRGFTRYDVPIIGIVENMAGFECPGCGTEHDVFGTGGADGLSEEFGVPVLGRLPLNPTVGTLDRGEAPTPPGLTIPGIGRLQLPRTQAERERPTTLAPIAVREGGGEPRAAAEYVATRAAARVNALVLGRSATSPD